MEHKDEVKAVHEAFKAFLDTINEQKVSGNIALLYLLTVCQQRLAVLPRETRDAVWNLINDDIAEQQGIIH